MDFLKLLEHHMLDHTVFNGLRVGHLAMPITKHTLMLWFGSGLLAVGLPLLAFRWPLVPRGFKNLIEIFVVFIRDEVVLPNTGEEGRPYLPYFLTVFFFILTVNLLGMIPGMSVVTGNISVTAALAICTFVLVNYVGIRKFGVVHYVGSFIPQGVPLWLKFLLFPLEVLGLFTKNFALCIRLFANMMAGHVVILTIISLIFLFGSFFVVPISVGLSLGLSALEVFVAFLQAYIFTLLSAIFVGNSLHPH